MVDVGHVLVDTLNLQGDLWGRLERVLERHYPEVVDEYRLIWHDRHGYAQRLAERATRAAERHHVAVELAL